MTNPKVLLSTLVTFALLLLQSVASAQSPHFVGTPTASFTEDFDLAVAFKEAGLGSAVTIDYAVTATASGSCACVTKSGNCPAAANKIPPTTVGGTGSFTSTKAGNIVGTVVAEEPECQQVSPATCPGGQTNTLTSVSYSDITIEDTSTPVGPVPTKPSSLSATIFTCP
jgi:hypothetical protein